MPSYLGETYQCHIDGNPLYLEYANEKAYGKEGITCEYYVGDKFTITGIKTGILDPGMSTATFTPRGSQTLLVKPNNHLIKWTLPAVYMKNPCGDRH